MSFDEGLCERLHVIVTLVYVCVPMMCVCAPMTCVCL